jgi:small nuclear ribonucleoprotein (snRNP)-like protein
MVLLVLPYDVMAKQATEVIIEKSDRNEIEGVLVNVDVEMKSLVVEDSGGGVKIYTDEIDTIMVKKKGTVLRGLKNGALFGGVMGLGCGIVLSKNIEREDFGPPGIAIAMCVLSFAVLGALGGMAVGAAEKQYKEIRVKGKSPDDIKEILVELKKKALVQD